MHRALPLLLFAAVATAADKPALPRSTPEEQGVSSDALRAFVEAADATVNTMHSVVVVRHGKVILEGWWKPEAADKPHVLWSLSKSFTSTAVGLVVDEGKLSLDDEVLKFFPEDAPEMPSDNLKKMRVRDLLAMNTGHETEPKAAADALTPKAFLAHPVKFKPGTHFQYNTPATFMLSAIVQKQTGKTVLDYLTPKLFEPLGIDKPRWDATPQGVNIGGYGLFLKTGDIAKFGQLYLQKGKWEGKQVVPEKWVEAATSKQTSNGSNPKSDWDQGYGYQFWRCRNGAFRGDGKDGQFCVVLPAQDAVVAITADTGDLQGVLNMVWDKLLPQFKDKPLPADAKGAEALKATLGKLEAKDKKK